MKDEMSFFFSLHPSPFILLFERSEEYMGLYTERMSEALTIPAAGVHSANQSTGSSPYDTAAIPLAKLRRVMFLIDVGVVGGSGTVDFKVRWCATSGGTYNDLSNTSITQITASTAYAIVEITTEQVINAQPTAKFIKGRLTIGTASSQVSVIPLGEMCRYEPASNLNDATVATPVVL
jgi:hypothetical protein